MVKAVKNLGHVQKTTDRMTNIVHTDNMQDFKNSAKGGEAPIIVLKRPILDFNSIADVMATRRRALKGLWDKYAPDGKTTSATSFQADIHVENGQFRFRGINGSSREAFEKIQAEAEDLSKLFSHITGHKDICLVTMASFGALCRNETKVPILMSSWQMANGGSRLKGLVEQADMTFITEGSKVIMPEGDQNTMYSVVAMPAIPMPRPERN